MTEKTSQPEKEKIENQAQEQNHDQAAPQTEEKKDEAVEKEEKVEENTTVAESKKEEDNPETSLQDEQAEEKKPESAGTNEPAPVKETAESAPVKETAESAPVKETDEPAPVKETNESAPVEETAEPAPVKDTDEPDNLDQEIEDEEDEEDEEDTGEDENLKKLEDLSREELVKLLEETVQENDISKIKTKVSLIKVAYLKATKEEQQESLGKSLSEEESDEGTDEGSEEENTENVEEKTPKAKQTDQLEERFNRAFEKYRQNRVAFNAEQEKIKQQNLETKKQILEDLKELINSEETLKNTYDQFKALQDRWKEIGMVPRSEVNNLWQSYHFLVEKFFDKVKINKELRDLDLKKNLEAKIELCEKAEELLLETSILKSFKALQKLHDKYKEVGPVPADKKDEVWERFKAATDRINQRRREHYAQLAEQQNANYEAKLALCEKGEDLLSKENNNMKDWQEHTKQMNELFKVWRSIGPAPKKVNDEVWDRFKSSLNTFFDNRREFFGKVKEQQLNNYNLKLNLCAEAESLQDNTDWKKTTDELIRLQKEWKRIGPAPRKYSDKVWKRFRAANDHFFNKKKEFFSHIHEHEAENLKAKKQLIEEVNNYTFGDNKNENLKTVKEFQRRWMDIGHVPIKEKDKIQQDFRKAIDSQMEKLHISAVEISTLNFKNKVENLKDEPNAKRALSKERNFLSGKVNKIKEDIILWENNMGFLASSKKADVLKNELNKKIEKAKQDVKIMEAKIKYLNSQL